MKDHLNWGVLGAANFALTTMAPAINEARRSRLVALATRNPEKAAPFAQIAPGLCVHDRYDALLSDPGIDAIYIPLPNAMHVDWAIRAAEAGKHVLCEKPMGMHATDFDRLIAVREATGRFMAEGWMPSHHPQWAKAREMIADGTLGVLYTVTANFSFGLFDTGNIRLDPAMGGGALRDIGVYPIGCFRFATELEPEPVWADAVFEHGVDTSAWVQLRAGDVRFAFDLSMRTQRRQGMAFQGTGGRLTMTAPFNAGSYGQADLILERDGRDTQVIRFPEARQYVNQVEAVSASVLDGLHFAWPLERARGTQVVLDSIFEQLGHQG